MNPEYLDPELKKRLDISRAKEDEKLLDLGGTKVMSDGRLDVDSRAIEIAHNEGDKNIDRTRSLDNKEIQSEWKNLIEEQIRVEREYKIYADHIKHRTKVLLELASALSNSQPTDSLLEQARAVENDKVGGAYQNVEWFVQKIQKFAEKYELDIPLLKKTTDEIVATLDSQDLVETVDTYRKAEMYKANESLGREINF